MLGLIAVVVLPLVYNLAPNPAILGWHWRHPRVPVPPDVLDRAHRLDKVLIFVELAGLAALLATVMTGARITLEDLGLESPGLRRAAVGCGAGALWLTFYVALFLVARPDPRRLAKRWEQRFAVEQWAALSITAAAIEETWRALCFVLLKEHSRFEVLAWTTVAFALGHVQSLGRFVAAALFGTYAGWLFLATNSLWVTISAHTIVNLGVYALIHLRWTRVNDARTS